MIVFNADTALHNINNDLVYFKDEKAYKQGYGDVCDT